jgi:hypothetical protein
MGIFMASQLNARFKSFRAEGALVIFSRAVSVEMMIVAALTLESKPKRN